MKILQVTSTVSYHQLPLAKELYGILGEDNFSFASMAKPNNNLKTVKSEDSFEKFIIYPNESAHDKAKFDKLWKEVDIVLCGERLINEMQQRVDNSKICFYMSERWWKPPIGILRLLHPGFLKMFLSFRKLSKSRFFHYLPTGPFAAKDITLFSKMDGRIWQWGYFTSVPFSMKPIEKKSSLSKFSVLWIGRMLNLKRVDLLIEAMHLLKNEGKSFHLTLVGEGPEREKLQSLSDKLLGDAYCSIQDFIPYEEVPELMAKHSVYVLPSNGNEGWGAVINEAMTVGCAVVASDKTGAGVTLIEHDVNGLLFKSGSVNSLYTNLNKLIGNESLINELGDNARSTIIDSWQPTIVAERFVKLATALVNDSEVKFELKGPLSKLY